jgi:drug/metabolite transporter (DMT)-like permease
MGASLALLAAMCFALAATLQQKGALDMGGGTTSFSHPASLLKLATELWWLAGTAVLFAGYVFQAVALDNGRLSVIQPLLVTTIVFALPLGYLITAQHVGRREIGGAVVVVLGLAVFALVGDPAGGRANAPNGEWAIAVAVVLALVGVLLALGSGGSLERKAGMYGAAAGLLYGLSASLWKPSAEMIDAGSVSTAFSHWQIYGCGLAGIAAFVVQQVSLGTGRLAPSVASTSVLNPILSVVLGIVLLEETLALPVWHKLVAWGGLALAMWGAIVISLAREGGDEAVADQAAAPPAPAL